MRPQGKKPRVEDTAGLTDAENGCPVPSAHDKLVEASYFFHEMIRNYHWPDEFRYSLGAFLQAARSVVYMLPVDLAGRNGWREWWKAREARLDAEVDWKLMKNYRDTVVHRASLFPSSTAFVGHFKYGKRKLGLVRIPLPPYEDSVNALLRTRPFLQKWEHPHRAWSGEECGIERSWMLKEIPERELVAFCASCWQRIAEVVFDIHDWQGCRYEKANVSEGIRSGYQILRESQVFPEVVKAWDSEPTEMVEGLGKNLELLEAPSPDSKVLQKIDGPKTVKGWVGGRSRFWSSNYRSMLIYSIGDIVITKSTAVFFESSKARVTTLPSPDDETNE
jgi:hypothetical protein